MNVPHNPCSGPFWAKVTREFRQLSASALSDLKEDVEDEAAEAESGRALRLAMPAHAIFSRSAPLPQRDVEDALVVDGESREATPLALGDNVTCLVGGVVDIADQASAAPDATRAMTTQSFKIVFDEWRATTSSRDGPASRRKKSTNESHAQEFRDEACKFARSRRKIPKRVIYDRSCSGLCARSTDPGNFSIFLQLKKEFNQIIRQERPGVLKTIVACCTTCEGRKRGGGGGAGQGRTNGKVPRRGIGEEGGRGG